MIEMGCAGELETFDVCDLGKHSEQRDRVGPARKSDKHTGARLNQSVSPEGAPD